MIKLRIFEYVVSYQNVTSKNMFELEFVTLIKHEFQINFYHVLIIHLRWVFQPFNHFATCFHSYYKLRFIASLSKVAIVEVPQVVTSVEWFSIFSQNHWVLVLECFWKTQPGSYLKFYFHLLKIQRKFQNLQKIILLGFQSVSFHTFYTNWLSKPIFTYKLL